MKIDRSFLERKCRDFGNKQAIQLFLKLLENLAQVSLDGSSVIHDQSTRLTAYDSGERLDISENFHINVLGAFLGSSPTFGDQVNVPLFRGSSMQPLDPQLTIFERKQYVAVSPSLTLTMSKSTFEAMLESTMELKFLYKLKSLELGKHRGFSTLSGIAARAQKISSVLLILSANIGIRDAGVVHIPISQQNLAKIIGFKRPYLSELLQDMESQGILDLGYGAIRIIDSNQLAETSQLPRSDNLRAAAINDEPELQNFFS